MAKHIPHLDGLRALAALFVLANHGFRMAWPNSPAVAMEMHPDGWLLALTSWMRYGHFAVTTFIAISGYCLMLPFVHAGRISGFAALPFYARRAWRILPTYYAALALSLLLIWTVLGDKTGTQWDAALPVTLEGIAVRLVLLQDVLLVNQINNPLWSVATEFRIYLLMPLVVVLFMRAGPLASVALVTGAIVVLQLLQAPFARHITATYLCVFCMGAAAAWAGTSTLAPARRSTVGALAALLLAAAFGLLAWLDLAAGLPYWRFIDIVVGAAMSMLLVHCQMHPQSLATRLLSLRALVFIGGFSYSIYLMHFPFQALVWTRLVMPLGLDVETSFGIFLLLGFPLVLALCWVFFVAFERPVLRHRPRFLARRPAAAPA
jgi:peptidoglycan/LPS O-acetylase OafA/YrhL